MSISIRSAKTIEDCQHIEELVQQCWGRDPLEVVPAPFTMAIIKNGGIVQIADDRQTPIGFSYACHAWDDKHHKLKIHSHFAGVTPAYRDGGIGARLKWSQRAAILAGPVELDLVTWTYDPLETRNARLNMRKLGAVSSTFIPNAYGARDDDFAAGLPTDRFQVEWWINSDWVEKHHRDPKTLATEAAARRAIAKPFNQVHSKNDLLYPDQINDNWDGERFMLAAVPLDFQAVKRRDMALATAWRSHAQELFETAFANDYCATDLMVADDRCFYLLEKEWSKE